MHAQITQDASAPDAAPSAVSDHAEQVQALFARIVEEEGQHLLGWREVPTDDRTVGASAVAVEPVFRQVFIEVPESVAPAADPMAIERRLYIIRKRVEHAIDTLDIDPAERKFFYGMNVELAYITPAFSQRSGRAFAPLGSHST